MTGYFHIARGLFEHDLFKSSQPFSEREAWIWLIEQANFANSKFRHHSQVFDIPRGSVATSYRKLATKWRWSVNRVIRVLKMFESQRMVDVKTEHGFVQLTICNYDKYQAPWNTNETRSEHSRNTRETVTDTNQIKEIKETKETKAPARVHPEWLPIDAWNAFREMRSRSRAKLTTRAEELIIRDLAKLRAEGHDPTAVLEQSVKRGWSGVFAIRAEQPRTSQRPAERKSNVTTLLPGEPCLKN